MLSQICSFLYFYLLIPLKRRYKNFFFSLIFYFDYFEWLWKSIETPIILNLFIYLSFFFFFGIPSEWFSSLYEEICLRYVSTRRSVYGTSVQGAQCLLSCPCLLFYISSVRRFCPIYEMFVREGYIYCDKSKTYILGFPP